MYDSSPLMAVLTPKSVIQLTPFIAFETGRKLNSVCCILLLVPSQTYIWQKKKKKIGIVNWPIEGKKQYVFARQLPHSKTYIQFKYPPINVHWAFLVGTWIWLYRVTDILLKGLLSDRDPRMLLLQWGLSSLGSVQFLQIMFSFSDILI